ncbi:SGNH/GDSL hydrolase family protein [Halosegnis rubeus]
MPRDGVEYRDTWIHKLRKTSRCEIVARTKRAATTKRLYSDDSLERYDPDIVVTQLGIVDCAPRYSNNIERRLFRSFPSRLTKRYMAVMKRVRARKARRSYVSVEDFRSYLNDYYERAMSNDITVYSIIIAPPSSTFIDSNPRIESETNRYNKIYESVTRKYDGVCLINPYQQVRNVDAIMVDNEHPNPGGHDLIYESVAKALSNTTTDTL